MFKCLRIVRFGLTITVVFLARTGLSLASGQPHLQVTSSSLQLVMKPNTTVNTPPLVATFNVKNVGASDVIIYSAVPSCGCSVVSFTHVIHPGRSGTVEVSLDGSRIYPGVHGIELQTNDPSHKTVTLEVNVVEDHAVLVGPEDFISFGRTSLAGGVVQKLTVSSSRVGFAPRIAYVSNDLVEAVLVQSTSVTGRFDLTLRLSPGSTPGLFKATIVLKTGLVDEPEISIPVSGTFVDQKGRKR